ncbi:MAG: hypothetical protein P1V21_10355 [Rhizobiaceae bacterium]|nr:hypothetical protein [Rhizobiaceae bacterium]
MAIPIKNRDTRTAIATEAEIESWKTDPDAAYLEAERRIEEAKSMGVTELDFHGEEFSYYM